MMHDPYLVIKSEYELPSPMGTALQLMRLAQKADATLIEFAGVVASDPAISARILQYANSAFSGVRQRLASVQRAVVTLGMKAVTRLSLCFSLISNHRRGPCVPFPYDLFWSDSLGRAAAARIFATRLESLPSEDAFTCALLSQIGRLTFAGIYPEEYGRILGRTPQGDSILLAELEDAAFQLNHCGLAARMFTDWLLPEEFQKAVRAQLDPDAGLVDPGSAGYHLARILKLSGLVSAVLTRTHEIRNTTIEMSLQANRLGITPESLQELFERIRAEWLELGSVLAVPTHEVPPQSEVYEEARRIREGIDDDRERTVLAVAPLEDA